MSAEHQSLQAAVQRLCTLSSELLAAVRAQQALLQAPAADALLDHGETVAALLAELRAAEQDCLQALHSLQLDPSDSQRWPLTPAQQTAWQDCQDSLRAAQDINAVNGRLLQLQARQTQMALDLLLGTDGAAPTYTPRGQARPHQHGQRLGLA